MLTKVSNLNKNSSVYLIVNHLSYDEIEFTIFDTRLTEIGLGSLQIIQEKNLHLYKKNSLIPRLNFINVELSHILILNLNKDEDNEGLKISQECDPVEIED